MLFNHIIEIFFSAALFINALLFIPQSIKIVKEKSAKSSSLITFLGLLLIQLTLVLRGFTTGDLLLGWGYVLSMVTTGAVVGLIIFYKFIVRSEQTNTFSADEIFDQLPGNIYWKNKDGVTVGCNKNNWKNFDLQSSADFIGKTDYDVLSKKEADEVRLLDLEVVRTGSVITTEEVLTTKGGKKSCLLSSKAPLKDKEGNIVGVLGLSIDSTTTKQKMLDKLEILDNIISIMPGNVYWMNREGVYLGCNDNQAEVIGLVSRKDIVGKRNIDLPGFLIAEALDPVNQRIMETGESITLEEPATLRDGTQITVISSKVPLKNSRDEVVGMVGISIDITDRKKQEKELIEAKQKAEESNKIKSDFISNMEHDIRTPFVGIYGLVNILADKLCSLGEEKRKAVIQFVVKDTGMGIPADKKSAIYEKFSRVTPSNKGLFKGLGLGLKIVKQFVAEMDGEINLESEMGQGTTFTVFIPFSIPFSNQVFDA